MDYFSASKIGKKFGLDGQEMNMALYLLGYLDGKPSNWNPTEKCQAYCEIEYKDNGYRGYGAQRWTEFKYKESIIEPLKNELTNDVLNKAKELVAERRKASKSVEVSQKINDIINDTQIDSLLGKNTVKLFCNQHTGKTDITKIVAFSAVAIAAVAGTVVIVKCVRKHKKQRRNAETKNKLK